MLGRGRQVDAGANPVMIDRVVTFRIFMVIARDTRVRTRRIVISAVRAILALLGFTDTAGHERLNFLYHLPEMNPPNLS